mgnify:CR=1 FL=1
MRTCKSLLWTLFIVQFVYSTEKIRFKSPDSVLIKQTLDSLLSDKNLLALQYEILHYNNEFKEITYQPLYASYDVDTVIINGVILKRDGQLISKDLDTKLETLAVSGHRIMHKYREMQVMEKKEG